MVRRVPFTGFRSLRSGEAGPRFKLAKLQRWESANALLQLPPLLGTQVLPALSGFNATAKGLEFLKFLFCVAQPRQPLKVRLTAHKTSTMIARTTGILDRVVSRPLKPAPYGVVVSVKVTPDSTYAPALSGQRVHLLALRIVSARLDEER